MRVAGQIKSVLGRRIVPVTSAALAVVATICLWTTYAQTHPDAKVPRVRAETEDSLTFEISVAKTTFAHGENIYVNYVVKNRGGKSAYLVVETSPKLLFRETWILELAEPVVLPDDHDPYDYDLIKILPGETFSGKLPIKAEQILANGKYNFEVAGIRAGFSYLFDISNLKGCKEAEYRLPCLKELYDKSKSLTIGTLVIDIKQK